MTDAATEATTRDSATGSRAGTWLPIQPSSVATSGATPGDVANTVASSTGALPMPVTLLPMVVPCLASTAPLTAPETTTTPPSCSRHNAPRPTRFSGQTPAPVHATTPQGRS